MTVIYHGSRLRQGRFSEQGRIYHVTTVTKGRYPYFSDSHLASLVCRTLLWSDLSGATTTLCYVLMPDHLHWLFQLGDDETLSKVGFVEHRSGSGVTMIMRFAKKKIFGILRGISSQILCGLALCAR